MAFARIPARIVALQDQLTMRKLPPKTLWAEHRQHAERGAIDGVGWNFGRASLVLI